MTSHLAGARTRELELERTLSHAQRLASLGRVAAGIAHEVRNPLASIKLRLDAMARRRLDERSADDISRCLNEVSRLDGVVQALLLVARKNAGPHEHVDLARLVGQRISELESFASDKTVQLTRSGAARGQLDAAAMTLVIDNLLRNGVEASPAGAAVVVELSTEGTDLLLRVTDQGAGVPVEKHSELFEPFFTPPDDRRICGRTWDTVDDVLREAPAERPCEPGKHCASDC
jgi:signal transduction histidine kinase